MASKTLFHKWFAVLSKFLPGGIAKPLRSFATAVLTPVFFSSRSGHFRSSLISKAISKEGEPLPWYTYPSIDFLSQRTYNDKVVLEFGGGQSTLWWAKRASLVVTFEGDKQWYQEIRDSMPANVELHYVSMESRAICIDEIQSVLSANPNRKFDVIVIDGLFRENLVDVARSVMVEDGMIICDDAESYQIFEISQHSELHRVDFFGHAPGVILPHCTSIFFNANSFAFSAHNPIPRIYESESR